MNTLITNRFLALLVVLGFVAVGISLFASQTFGHVASNTTAPIDIHRAYTFFATTTAQVTFATSTASGASATSTSINAFFDDNGQLDRGYFVIAGAKSVELYFGRSAATTTNNGATTYTIQVTPIPNPTEADWYNAPKLIQSTSTAQQVNGSISAASTIIRYALDLSSENYYAVRCIASVTSLNDGKNTCSATARF